MADVSLKGSGFFLVSLWSSFFVKHIDIPISSKISGFVGTNIAQKQVHLGTIFSEPDCTHQLFYCTEEHIYSQTIGWLTKLTYLANEISALKSHDVTRYSLLSVSAKHPAAKLLPAVSPNATLNLLSDNIS